MVTSNSIVGGGYCTARLFPGHSAALRMLHILHMGIEKEAEDGRAAHSPHTRKRGRRV